MLPDPDDFELNLGEDLQDNETEMVAELKLQSRKMSVQLHRIRFFWWIWTMKWKALGFGLDELSY